LHSFFEALPLHREIFFPILQRVSLAKLKSLMDMMKMRLQL